jgi:dynein heavy chain
VRDDPEMRDEFCYLKKRDDPYDWEIVQFEKIES